MTPPTQLSAGILVFRLLDGELEVLLGHPGGPYFANRDLGAWGIPKGHVEEGEQVLAAATREFEEETGFPPPGPLIPLGEIRQRGGKNVSAWGAEWDRQELPPLDSSPFEMEWPPRSGRTCSYPELDQLRFFRLDSAKQYMNDRQFTFVERLVEYLKKQGVLAT